MTNYTYLGQTCDQCGRQFYTGQLTGRPRRFCSNACRQRHYRRTKEDAAGLRLAEDARMRLETAEFRNTARVITAPAG